MSHNLLSLAKVPESAVHDTVVLPKPDGMKALGVILKTEPVKTKRKSDLSGSPESLINTPVINNQWSSRKKRLRIMNGCLRFPWYDEFIFLDVLTVTCVITNGMGYFLIHDFANVSNLPHMIPLQHNREQPRCLTR
jgi:hypothetical protein